MNSITSGAIRRISLVFAGILIVLFSGCVDTSSTDPSFMSSRQYLHRSDMQTNLFETDEAVISGDKIQAILNSRILIPSNCRLAVMTLNEYTTHGLWSPETTQAGRDFKTEFLSELKQCGRLADVSFLPGILTPEKKGIGQLREAAARYQAPLLFVYSTQYNTYGKDKIFGKGKAVSYCIVEGALLDVQTGTVPFTSVSLQEFEVEEKKGDINFYETLMRAEMSAESKGLKDIAKDLTTFLDKIP